jgi:hypothetical protein
VPWDDKPLIFTEEGVPATNSAVANARFQQQMEEEQAQDELPRICPWCGLLCESVEAELEHEKVCE